MQLSRLLPDALERARSAEEKLMRGDNLGCFHGLPITIKDTIETADLRTTSGSVDADGLCPKARRTGRCASEIGRRDYSWKDKRSRNGDGLQRR